MRLLRMESVCRQGGRERLCSGVEAGGASALGGRSSGKWRRGRWVREFCGAEFRQVVKCWSSSSFRLEFEWLAASARWLWAYFPCSWRSLFSDRCSICRDLGSGSLLEYRFIGPVVRKLFSVGSNFWKLCCSPCTYLRKYSSGLLWSCSQQKVRGLLRERQVFSCRSRQVNLASIRWRYGHTAKKQWTTVTPDRLSACSCGKSI